MGTGLSGDPAAGRQDGRQRPLGPEAAGAHETAGDGVVVHGLRGDPRTGGSLASGLWKAQLRKLGEVHFWRARRSRKGVGAVGYVDS